MSKYEYPKNVDYISGFGVNSGYELTCQKMVIAGMEWLDNNTGDKPEFHGYQGVYGIIQEDNEAAKSLSKAVVEAADNDCTGAMHQASITHALKAHELGWEEYLRQLAEHNK